MKVSIIFVFGIALVFGVAQVIGLSDDETQLHQEHQPVDHNEIWQNDDNQEPINDEDQESIDESIRLLSLVFDKESTTPAGLEKFKREFFKGSPPEDDYLVLLALQGFQERVSHLKLNDHNQEEMSSPCDDDSLVCALEGVQERVSRLNLNDYNQEEMSAQDQGSSSAATPLNPSSEETFHDMDKLIRQAHRIVKKKKKTRRKSMKA
uniref:Uncharacterized protein n=2 Tax=Spongospora subterranea TaxID=70186 RepID=A0A0H5QH92_9EUKA|eukprot:CRZ01027.1 hypothetical protein [Spongospora subterranea]